MATENKFKFLRALTKDSYSKHKSVDSLPKCLKCKGKCECKGKK